MLENYKPEGYTIKELSELLNKLMTNGYADYKIHISGDYVEHEFYHGNLADIYTDHESKEVIFDSEEE